MYVSPNFDAHSGFDQYDLEHEVVRRVKTHDFDFAAKKIQHPPPYISRDLLP